MSSMPSRIARQTGRMAEVMHHEDGLGPFGDDVGVVNLTGAAGDTAPRIMEDNPQNHQPWRGEAGVVRSGQYLGGEILKVIAAQTKPMVEPILRH